MTERHDLLIIGSGPGGYVAAIRAAQLGMRVGMVERARPGGICLNWGCIPTKALLRSSEIYHLGKNAEAYGITVENLNFDLPVMVERSRKVAQQLSVGVQALMRKNKVAVIEGTASLLGNGRISVVKGDVVTEYEADNIILATGARARELPFAKSDGDRIWTYPHALMPAEVPADLLVIGSGAIGCEFASFFTDLGARVTIVEMLDRILPVEDEEVSAFVAADFVRQGMTILTGHRTTGLEVTPGRGVVATLSGPNGELEPRAFSHVIVAVGIVPNTENIGLEALGVATDRGHLVADEYGCTNVEGIWAIGDIVGAPWLAHKASHEGVIAVEAIAGLKPHALDRSRIPGCTYSRPQVASIGLTEAKARELGFQIRTGSSAFTDNGRAITLGDLDGFVKTVWDDTSGELLGAHLVGPEVTELIQGFAIAKQAEATAEALFDTSFAYPTLSGTMHEAVLAAYGRAVHG
jgi:dihydrolipoamide dehydrogenase